MKRRLTFLIGSMLSAAALLWALSSGPLSAGLGANVAGAGVNWANPTNIYTSNDVRATAALAASGFSDYLRSTTYGFAIPPATINGIVGEIERSYTGTGNCDDLSVKIVKGGAETGTEKAMGAWPTPNDAYDSFGGPADLWGTAWTSADINANDFGLSVSAQETGGSDAVSARVDHVRITVYYTPSSGRKAFIINVGSLLPAWMPAPFVIAGLPMAQTREGRKAW